MDQQQFERALEACASEPIHQIGHVQPHGALLAFAVDASRQVFHASRNVAEFIGRDAESMLGQCLADLVPADVLASIETLIATLATQPTASGKARLDVDGRAVSLSLHAYRADSVYVLEMEHDDGQRQETRLAELLLNTQQAMLRTDSYFETEKYFNLLVQFVRSLTGYDNVMVYRFDAQWNGEIIAQSGIESAPSYLGMHFPASDIPAQARRLYTTNLVRVVADIDAIPVPIVPELNPATGQPLDLSYSALRSLSPIHMEYLRNIGVQASMVISLMQNDRLWGLIACHHLSPKRASMGLRDAAIFLSRLVSTRLSALEAIEERRIADRANTIIGDLLRVLPTSAVTEILPRLLPEFQALLDASGMIVIVEGDIHLQGETPDQACIACLLEWLATKPGHGVVVTDFLGGEVPALARCSDTMAGVLATPPSADMRNCIIWLRKEKPRTINWAGKYEEGFVQNAAGNFRLTPRKSFELWSESWLGRSSPWTTAEVGVANVLALAIPESLAQKRNVELAQDRQHQAEAQLRLHLDQLEDLVRERTLALSIAKEAAESASRAKTVFLSTVSHELRTPLNGIMGLTSLSLRRAEEPRLHDYLVKIDESSKRLLAIINDMIDISDIEAERLTLEQVDFQLVQLIERIRVQMTSKSAEKNLALNVEFSPDLVDCCLLGDRERLEQILLALVENAIKFTTAGSIAVRCHTRPGDSGRMIVRFEVQDTGIGIRKDSRARLFNAFEQADGSSTRRYGGAGLGLAICKRLARMMDGDIGVDSVEGVGSTFWFHVRLPIVPHQRLN
ncbi:MAG: bacteriophytochrome [Proteobacteria bacterium]|nr:bacteriophytochrome [Pseudomonadota bacterium]